jgi:hypothetical protein
VTASEVKEPRLRVPDCRLGQEGIIDWWCTGQEEAFSAERPVYLSIEEERRRVRGDDVYTELGAYRPGP